MTIIIKKPFLGPYSYYASSTQMTAIAKAEHMLLSLKGFNVFILPYYEWNSLKTEEDKMKYLSNFGKIAASSISAVPWSPNVQ
ncbi:hypothetical protein BEWA_043120 [Theileria equi strain WA]|uniref:RAP domain-containing protein n=1 Tax=Theileria equi strain WA TaxID=1537102 RepID=L1LG08_THEEQ|nr:hypothetical protein BEWA_043120 [Theileria equi strain WA]EKX74271.1 hypothetical protein BEWA_043120 [Theileria equi strain WA]|eukprot:XP_004833723.1 hypothetical protein BEWA_043120 [Theileria equi strain WA]